MVRKRVPQERPGLCTGCHIRNVYIEKPAPTGKLALNTGCVQTQTHMHMRATAKCWEDPPRCGLVGSVAGRPETDALRGQL